MNDFVSVTLKWVAFRRLVCHLLPTREEVKFESTKNDFVGSQRYGPDIYKSLAA